MTRVVVIGAGVAGLTAAIRLARAGVGVTLVSKGTGGLQLSQGTVDVLGYDPVRVTQPLQALAALAATDPKHPYAAIGRESVEAGLAYLVEVVGPDLLAGDPSRNLNLPTAVGAVRPTCLAQPSMLAGACVDGATFVIVGLRQLKDFPAHLVAANLVRTVLPDGGRLQARPVVLDLPARDGEIDSSGLTYARAFDDADYRKRFVAALRPLLKEGETVGLPAVLGLGDLNAWRDIADKLGHPVFEIPLQPPSVPGMRLNEALLSTAKAAGVRFVQGNKVVSTRIADGRVAGITVAQSGADKEYVADAFLLATGGFESGALAMDSHGSVTETVFGLPLAGLDAGELVHGDYWGAQQPLFAVGVSVEASMRPLDEAGQPVYPNLFAAGGILGGAHRWSEKSGDGIAVGSAVKAADSIVKELS
ncbi:MAG: glycerol-3-phosphate dehydrogenase subunit GlpB [Propionicimonas sp.]